MHPDSDPDFDQRVKIDRLVLREAGKANTVSSLDDAMALILSRPTGRINVRGANGSGKSTLLTSLKSAVQNACLLLADRGSAGVQVRPGRGGGRDRRGRRAAAAATGKKPGFSSGERQLRALREIVTHTEAPIYLLDEWDANLDPNNRAAADALVEELAQRARVVEISHRDRV